MKRTKKELEEDVRVLKQVIVDTLWCAVRYAHGRSTYAPHTVRDAYQQLINRFPDDSSLVLREDTVLVPVDLSTTIRGDNLHDLWQLKPEKRNV